MSMSPGKSVRSPSSMVTESFGTDVGATSTIRSPSMRSSPGSTSTPLSTSSRRALLK